MNVTHSPTQPRSPIWLPPRRGLWVPPRRWRQRQHRLVSPRIARPAKGASGKPLKTSDGIPVRCGGLGCSTCVDADGVDHSGDVVATIAGITACSLGACDNHYGAVVRVIAGCNGTFCLSDQGGGVWLACVANCVDIDFFFNSDCTDGPAFTVDSVVVGLVCSGDPIGSGTAFTLFAGVQRAADSCGDLYRYFFGQPFDWDCVAETSVVPDGTPGSGAMQAMTCATGYWAECVAGVTASVRMVARGSC